MALLPPAQVYRLCDRLLSTPAIKRSRGVLLITPESLETIFIRPGLEMPRLFDSTRAVIPDELHSVLDSERGIHMRSLLARLERPLNHPIRRVSLSATLNAAIEEG